MTRETKVGLIVGMGVILLIGIIVSDHLSVVQQQEPAVLTENTSLKPPGNQSKRTARWDHSSRSSRTTSPSPLTGSTMADRPAKPLPLSGASSRDTQPAARRAPVGQPPRQLTPLTPTVEPSPPAKPKPRPRFELPQQPRLAANADSTPVPSLGRTQEDPRRPSGDDQTRTGLMTQHPDRVDPPASLRLKSDPAVTSASTPAPVIHYVRSGQTLWQIAMQYYNDGEQWEAIARANPKSVQPNGGVREGVRLVIPNKATLTDAPPVTLSSIARQVKRQATRESSNDHGDTTAKRTLTVRPGDSLTSLAQQHLGSSGRWRDLYEANRDQLDSPDYLTAGLRLRLPARRSKLTQGSIDDSNTPRSAGPKNTYTVKASDTLTSIAQKKLGDGDRWQEIYDANRKALDSPDDIYVGQRLVLPNR